MNNTQARDLQIEYEKVSRLDGDYIDTLTDPRLCNIAERIRGSRRTRTDFEHGLEIRSPQAYDKLTGLFTRGPDQDVRQIEGNYDSSWIKNDAVVNMYHNMFNTPRHKNKKLWDYTVNRNKKYGIEYGEEN